MKITRYLFVVLILLVGVWLRTHQLANFPSSAGWDPAFYGVDALQILQGDRPVYFATNFGREALYSYLVAGMFAAIGATDFSLHLTTAFCGMITIAATYRIAAELLLSHDENATRYYAPIIATSIVAISYWHIVWSRFGVRAVLAPTFICLVIYFLIRGLHQNNRWLLICAGLLGGFSIYSYQITQLLPLLVLVILLHNWQLSWKNRSSLLISLLLSVLVVLPLGWYAINNPDVYNSRIRDVALYSEEGTQTIEDTIKSRIIKVADFFFLDGEIDPKFSTIGKQGIDRLSQIGFICGLFMMLWKWRQPYTIILWSWLLIMILPAILADSEPVSKRAIGMIPAVAIISAIGLVALLSSHRLVWRIGSITIPILFAFISHDNISDYLTYVSDPAVRRLFDPQISEMATYIGKLPDDQLVYLSAEDAQHPNMLLHSQMKSSTSRHVRGYNGWHCLVFPAKTKQSIVYTLSEPNSAPLLQSLYPTGTLIDQEIPDKYGFGDYYHAYHIPTGIAANFSPQYPHIANWSDQFELHGYDLADRSFNSGDIIELTVYLSTLQRTQTRYTFFVHLVDTDSADSPSIYGQRDVEPCNSYYPTSVWHPGEIIRDHYAFQISPNIPPGRYQLMVGFYTWQDGVRLPVGDRDMVLLHSVDID